MFIFDNIISIATISIRLIALVFVPYHLNTILLYIWPFNFREYRGTSEIRFSGLDEREAEATCYCDRNFQMEPPPGGQTVFQFLDINPTLVRLMGGKLEDDFSIKADATTVWRNEPPTLTGSARILVRVWVHTWPCPQVRVLEVWEEARLIGWFDHCWQALSPEQVQDPDLLYNISSMLGNAYSLYQYGPYAISLLATYGRFRHWTPPSVAAASSGRRSDDVARTETDDASSSSSSSS